MKKYILILVQVCLLMMSAKIIAQPAPSSSVSIISPGGIFDVVFDRFGNQYSLSNLNMRGTHAIGGPNNVSSLPTSSCNAGYFTLWFTPGCLCALNSTAQGIMCEVFSNVSGLLSYSNSPLSSLSNTVKVNILVDDISPSSSFSNAAAVGSPFYVFPYAPSNPNPGIIESQIQKTIITASDPYANIPSTFNNGTSFYHGAVYTNTNPAWNFTTTSTTITPGTYDFYSIILHEAMHTVGILSLVNSDGYSAFGQTNNYFGIYDRFLYDYTGNPLLGSSTATSCPNTNISFAPASTSVIVPGLCTNTTSPTDLTNCLTAAQYSSTNVNIPLYTPNCWEAGSSLSHFEDLCGSLGSTVSASCFTANGNSNNNLYYVMANFAGSTSCYVKRYLKEEERKVLCDLGYSVSATFTSNAVIDGTLTSHPYTAGACSPTAVVLGMNDGLVNGAYIYTTTGTSLVISNATLLALLANDLPATGLTITCLDLVYTTNATLTPGATDYTVNAPANSGLVLLKYYPMNSAGQLGNATYVYVYFLPASCNGSGLCNLVNNGGFETANFCGDLNLTNGIVAACWTPIAGTNYLYSYTCTSGANAFNLGNNTLGTPPGTPMVSYSGNGNNNVMALSWINYPPYIPGAIKNNLSAPIVPTNTYQISLFANNYLYPAANNTNSVVITVASSSVYAFTPIGPFPAGLDVLAEFTLSPGTNWSQLTQTFVFTPSVANSHYALVVGINKAKTLAIPGTTWNPSLTSTLNPNNGIFCFIDDISIAQFPIPTFSIPSPTICGNQSFTNLSQYVSPTTSGGFTGPSVTNPTTTVFNFNYNSIISPGVYPIGFTYSSTTNTCVNIIYQMVTIGSNTNFVTLNPANLCLSTPTLDLNALVTNTTITGTTFSIGTTQVTSPYTFTAAGQYTLSASNTSTNVCSSTIYTTTINVFNPSTPVIYDGIISVSSESICSGNTLTLTASSSASLFTWQPGNLSGATQNLSPTVTTIYTITAFDYSLCTATKTLAVVIVTNCCNGVTLTPFTATSISGYNYLPGPFLVSSDFTIQSGGTLAMFGTYLFNPNIKITVDNGGEIDLSGARLAACTNTMWQGIIVKDGGLFQSYNFFSGDNLIEDAITAIDASSQTSSTLTPSILNVTQTTFNKNYVDIIISNYSRTVTPYPFFINNCVFTCRDLSSFISPTAWPQTTLSAGGLRYASTPTTGLAPPYIDPTTFPFTNLKSPYSSQPSHIAIQISSVGVTSGTTMTGIVIGDNSTAADFNLFDAHNIFISDINSNVISNNNVFQNTQVSGTLANVGTAIYQEVNNVMNASLDLTASSFDVGNRFWDCHKAIETNNLYRFHIEKGIFRSTQNSAISTTFSAGNTGIRLNTNRFSYYMLYNEFTNIANCIHVPILAGTFTAAATGTVIQNGIYASHLAVLDNTLSTGAGSGNYIDKAIDISCNNTTGWTMANDYNVSPSIIGVRVQRNSITNAFRGVYVNGMVGFPATVGDNVISLADDNVFAAEQHGIDLSNSLSANNVWGQQIISTNTLSSTNATAAASSSLASLVYCGHNVGLVTPSVSCNNLSSSYNGFVFNSTNSLSLWGGNKMTLPFTHGLLLSFSGVMGQQGSSNTAGNNEWAGGTWSGNSFGTFLTSGSDAASSPLYVKTGNFFPPNNSSGIIPGQIFGLSNTTYTVAGGDYTCGDFPNNRISISVPDVRNYESEEMYYIAKIALYHFLHVNDSVRNSDPVLIDFYSAQSGTSVDAFTQMEDYMYAQNSAAAQSISSDLDISPFNGVETNYKAYYDLYIKYVLNTYTGTDNTTLLTLANLCPGSDGACIYQARALYNAINKTSLNYPDCEHSAGAKMSNTNPSQLTGRSSKTTWNVAIYPNPTDNQLTLKSSKENEVLNISIQDLSNRILLSQNLKTKDFIANLDLSLINGAYFITISNESNEKITKKLLIAK